MEFVTAKGAKVVMAPGSWEETHGLRAAVQRAAANTPDNQGALQMGMRMESSPEVYDALFLCLARCTYNGQKITKATFENEDARYDYDEIVRACIEVNQRPFAQTPVSPFLAFIGLTAQSAETQA